MPAIVMRNLCFDFGPTKLVVFRVDHQDLPHLTFSWKNQSGEIDMHLTPPSPRDANDRESILKIQESDLKARVGELGRQFWKLAQRSPIPMVWCVSPKWLAARGYVLVGSRGEPVSLWLQAALPKKRGKYRLDERALKRSPKAAPSILRPLETLRGLRNTGRYGPYAGRVLSATPYYSCSV